MAAANESRVLRFFGVEPAEVEQAAAGLAGRCGLAHVESRAQGAETLLALTAPPRALHRAGERLRRAFAGGLYGAGGDTLADCTAQALVGRDRLLACADPEALALLASRLEGRPGISRVFDFGAGSCLDAALMAKVDARVSRAPAQDPLADKLCRMQAAVHLTHADLMAGVLARDGDTLVLLARRKGCWVCSVPPEGSPALWLLDMIRRAAKRLPQAKGVRYCRAGRAHGAARRWRTRLLLALLLAAAVGLVLALQATGGDLSALPQLLRSLAGASQPPAHSGAIFL